MVFGLNTSAAVLGLGYIIGLKYAMIITAGSCLVWFVIMAYFRPMIYPRPSTAAEVFSPKTTLNLSAATAPHSQMRVETDSVHSPNVPTTKSYNPPTSPATASSLACEPPFSPETRTSVVAVASGKGYLPCISLTKYLRKGISRTMPSRPPNSDERNTCQKAASRPRM